MWRVAPCCRKILSIPVQRIGVFEWTWSDQNPLQPAWERDLCVMRCSVWVFRRSMMGWMTLQIWEASLLRRSDISGRVLLPPGLEPPRYWQNEATGNDTKLPRRPFFILSPPPHTPIIEQPWIQMNVVTIYVCVCVYVCLYVFIFTHIIYNYPYPCVYVCECSTYTHILYLPYK